MLVKYLTGILTILAGLGVAIGYQYKGMPTSMDILTRRVTDLEVQNMELFKQINWMEEQLHRERQKASANSAKTARQISKLSETIQHTQFITATDSWAEYDNMDEVSGDTFPEEISLADRPVVETNIPVSPPSAARAYSQVRKSFIHNLDKFAKQNQLDQKTREFIADVLEESVGAIEELRSQNMDWPDFAEQAQRMQEDMDTKLSSVLSKEQMVAFQTSVLFGSPNGSAASEK